MQIAGGEASGNDLRIAIDAMKAIGEPFQRPTIIIARNGRLHVGLVHRCEDGHAPSGDVIGFRPIAAGQESLGGGDAALNQFAE